MAACRCAALINMQDAFKSQLCLPLNATLVSALARMTAAIGHPTLRLMRVRIGGFRLDDLAAGTWRELARAERTRVMGG